MMSEETKTLEITQAKCTYLVRSLNTYIQANALTGPKAEMLEELAEKI
jgi:hypothetical protein